MVTLVSETKLTLAKLADIAGVSTSTASRALKDNPLIKQETRSRIQALAKEHNFSINAAASRLRTQKTHVIAVILNLIDNTEQSTTDPFLLKLVGELNQALNAKGYELLLSNSFMASDDWANYFIRSQRADGIIVIGQGKWGNHDSLILMQLQLTVLMYMWVILILFFRFLDLSVGAFL